MKRSLCLFLIFFTAILSAETTLHKPLQRPWLTGPLLTASGSVVEKGHMDMEPYLFYIVQTGIYDHHWQPHSIENTYTLSPQLYLWVGLTDRVDFNMGLLWIENWTRDQSYRSLSDTSIGFDFQLLKEDLKKGYPAIKLSIQELFPTGNYDGFRTFGLGTDLTGLGTFVTYVNFVCSKLTYFYGTHYLSTAFNLSVALPTPSHVQGINSYGGSPNTDGTIFPGTSFFVFFGNEYTLSTHWALALDVACRFSQKVTFEGTTTLPVGYPPLTQFSLAPAIEYNWNESMGVIVGSWFTVAGRNSARFINGVAAVNLYF